MVKLNIILFLLFIVPYWNYAQFSYNKEIEQLHSNVLSLNYNLQQQKTSLSNEPNGLYYWLLAYNSFIQYHFGNTQLTNENLKKQLNSNYDRIKQYKKHSPFYYYCLTEICLYIAFTEIDAGNFFSAGKNLIAAYKYIEKNKSENPKFSLNFRHELIQLSIDYWLIKNIPFFFRKGKEEAGKKLRCLVDKNINYEHLNDVFESESKLLIAFISSRILDDAELKNQLVLSFSENWKRSGPLQVLAYNEFGAATLNADKKEALSFALNKQYNNHCNKLNLAYGTVLLNELNDSCLFYFDEFKKNQKSNRNIMYTNLKMCWYFFIHHAYDSVSTLIEESKQIMPVTNNDKQALYEFSNIAQWDSDIIKARVLFDGGFYTDALNILSKKQVSIKKSNTKKNVEVNYRLARIYHEMRKYDEAIELYNLVISSNTETQFYYASYSAYYLGYIYEMLNQSELAINSYKECLKLNSPVYQENIHRKAIHRIEYLKK